MQQNDLSAHLNSLHALINELNGKVDALNKALNKDSVEKEWLTLAEAAKFAGVSHNTFKKIREAGLKVSDIDGTKRVNKYELNSFLKKFHTN